MHQGSAGRVPHTSCDKRDRPSSCGGSVIREMWFSYNGTNLSDASGVIRKLQKPYNAAAKKLISDNNDMLDAWYAARGIVSERSEMKATIARLAAENAALTEQLEAAREVTIGVTASLVAALSIIERADDAKKRPSAVIASDKMYRQMVSDYYASVSAARFFLEVGSCDDAENQSLRATNRQLHLDIATRDRELAECQAALSESRKRGRRDGNILY